MHVYEALSKMHDALEMARCHSLVRQAVMGVLGEGVLTRLVAVHVSGDCGDAWTWLES